MKLIKLFSLLPLLFLLSSCSEKKEEMILPFHSHNDYEQLYPFTTAFEARVKSIEADLYRVGDTLYVAHNFDEISKGRTLRDLYLEPIKKAYIENKLKIYANSPLFILLDIKRESDKVYPLLDSILSEYQEFLTVYMNGEIKKRVVQIIVSGDKPIKLMQKQSKRFAFIDGTISQITENYPTDFIPLYSDDWAMFFHWNGLGNPSEDELKEMEKYASLLSERNAYLRFWNTPKDTEEQRRNIYSVLSKYNNVIIGTDNIAEAKEFIVDK